ncbi:MAG: VTT domain-containing protein [Betaproteobacteria bacterium]
MNTPHDLPNKRQNGTTLRLLALLGAIAVVLLLVFCTPLGTYLQDREAIEELAQLARNGDYPAIIIFIATSSLLIMIGTPRLIFFTFGSFAFGLIPGLLYSLCGCMTGSFLAFCFARWGARQWLNEHFGSRPYFRRIIEAEPGILSIALFRFLPISNALVNVALALSNTGLRAFFLGSLLGYLPQGIIASLIGSGLAQDAAWSGTLQIGIAGVLLIALLLWTARIRRKPS